MVGRVKHLWNKRSVDIIQALQSSSGLQFTHGAVIKVGYTDDDWGGSAGYMGEKAILLLFPRHQILDFDKLAIWLIMHELGHRLLEQHGLKTRYSNLEDIESWHEREHRLLFLFLIDALDSLGDDGRRIKQNFPERGYSDVSYGNTRAWRWARSFSPEQRSNILHKIVRSNNYANSGRQIS